MKIATWNIERLKHRKSLDKILFAIESIKADILVLTETDEALQPLYKYKCHTPKLSKAPLSYSLPAVYSPSENRVSIFSNYPIVKEYETYDKYTALCVEIATPMGNLLVYGTIIGIVGNRHPSFKEDLIRQCDDFKRFSNVGSLCVCGDFNCTFTDNYCFTKFGRNSLQQVFADTRLKILTEHQPECIDHIAISHDFVSNNVVVIEEWNIDKSLSDHKGIAVAF